MYFLINNCNSPSETSEQPHNNFSLYVDITFEWDIDKTKVIQRVIGMIKSQESCANKKKIVFPCRERTQGEHNIYVLIFEGLSCGRKK